MRSVLFANGTQRAVTPDDWHALIIARGYKAAIFDCDGTLVNSSEAHFQSFQYAVLSQGRHMDRSWYLDRTGLDRVSLFEAFAAETGGEMDVARAVQKSIAAFILNSEVVSPILETANLVKALGESFPMTVGTNAESSVARASLQATGLIDYFSRIVSISDGLPAKPAPDIFQTAASSLGFPASQILVFEDSNEGVSAACAADLDVIQLIHK